MEPQNIFTILSILGTAVFAVSGAMQALRMKMDIVGVIFIACVTGVGGGTMRDLLLGDTPVGWVTNPTDIFVCTFVALAIVFVNKRILGKRLNYLLWADAAGLALFAVLGALKASNLDAHPFIAVLFGAMSATFGGIIRDILCAEVPVFFRKEIYFSAALVGATAIILLPESIDLNIRITLAVIMGFLVRAMAIRFSWRLPDLN